MPLLVVALNPKVQGGDFRSALGFPKTDMRTTPTEKSILVIIGSRDLTNGQTPQGAA